MKKMLLAGLIILAAACTKNKTDNDKTTDPPEGQTRCGTILETPTLDSFVSPTFYISMTVRFKEGEERIHFHADVTGDHDGSWFLPRYDRDSTICIPVP